MKKIITIITISLILLSCSEKKNKSEEKLTSEKTLTDELISKNQQENKNVESPDDLNIEIESETEITHIENGQFLKPRFSNDDNILFFTNSNFSQIWNYNLNEKSRSLVSDISGIGYKYSISKDGKYIYARNKARRGREKDAKSKIIEIEISTKKVNVLYSSANSLTPPTAIMDGLFFLENNDLKCIDLKSKSMVEKIEGKFIFSRENKLFRYQSGKIEQLFPNRSDIVDATYSSDKELVICLTEKNGVLLLNIDGLVVKEIKNATSVSKLNNSNLLVIGSENDDGLKITNADISIGFTNSDNILELENSSSEIRFDPYWSPTGNKIAYTNSNGIIKILSLKN